MTGMPPPEELAQRLRELKADYSASRRKSARLADENRRLVVLLDRFPHPLMRIRADRTILWANQAAREAGARTGGLCWRDFGKSDYIPEEHKAYIRRRNSAPPGGTQCVFCLADAALSSQEPANDPEVRAFKGVWDIHWLPINMTTYLNYAMDITDRKRGEEERIRVLVQAHQHCKAESLGRMAGAIAHRFNNQLSSIMGNLEMAMCELQEDHRAKKYLAESMAAARKSAEVCRLILTYMGQAGGEKRPLDLSETCRTTLPLLNGLMTGDISLKTAFNSPGPWVFGDVSRLQEAVNNLVTNAVEALDGKRGAVRLSTDIVPMSSIPESHRFPAGWVPSPGDYACLEVLDTGRGIDPRVMENLFDPFYSDKFTGRGLGLPAVLGIVKDHGGGVLVESEPGRGSTFRVFLPVIPGALPRPAEGLVKGKGAETGRTVLLVEDQDSVRIMVKRLLEHMGFEVITAADGYEAVERFRENPDRISCVLTDLTMPGMNGWETLAALRSLRPDVPAVMVSGYEEVQAMAGDHSELPQAFLHKPYSKDELNEVLNRILRG